MAKIEKLDGGGTGGVRPYNNKTTSSNGGAGTSYSGGTGGGGTPDTGDGNPTSGSLYGGHGGIGWTDYGRGDSNASGGGAGNPAGYGKAKYHSPYYFTNSNGTGGLMIIYANNIINNFEIQSKGTSGGYARIGGGSSGGGSINLFYNEEYFNKGTVIANGGTSVGKAVKGGAGGTGSISIGSILTGTYVSIYTNY